MVITKRFSRVDAAIYLTQSGCKTSPKTLAKLAVNGGGPKFRKFGHRVIYELGALDEWMNDKISQPFENTAQIKEARNQINSAKASEPPLCATTEKKELTNQVPSLPPTTDFGMSGAIANEEA